MGCCSSRLMEKQEAVSRCKGRRRYMKQLVKTRQAFAAAHSLYLHSLRSTGAALLQFAKAETHDHQVHHLQHHHRHLPPLPSPSKTPPPIPSPPLPPRRPPRSHVPMSPLSVDTWTNSSVTASPVLPPPPPPPPSSSWDFWDPFMPSSTTRSRTEEEWEEVTTTTVSEVTAAPAMVQPPSVVSGYSKDSGSELAMVVVQRGNKKDLFEVVQELDEYFIKAAEAGSRVSVLLEAPNCDFSSNQGLAGKLSSSSSSSSCL